MAHQKDTILIVDDTPKNIQVLGAMLIQQDYHIHVAQNGQQALDAVTNVSPDLILLDIMMPEMDGFEVCKRLQASSETQDIPIIFLTAKAETEDVVRGFELGAVDYVTKPFRKEELLARVKTHLTLRHAKQELHDLNTTKDIFFSIMAHDLRGPMNSLTSLLQFTAENLDTYGPEKLKEIVLLQQTTTEKLSKLLENLLTWSRIQRGVLEYIPQQIPLQRIVERNKALFATTAEQKQISIKNSISEDITIYADLNMLDTVLRNLMSNALKFTEAGGEVEVSSRQNENIVEVAVSDTGIGIEQEHLPKLFRIDTRYQQLGTAREKGTGLGLILCKEFIEQHGGTISVESTVGEGTTFRFTLPQSSEE